MASYRFLSTWLLDAPIDRVFDAIHDYRQWPQWWRGVLAATELEPADANGIGGRASYTWRSRIPYKLQFEVVTTQIERPYLMQGNASGELEGSGTWRLYEGAAGTAVCYDWNVRTTRTWMNLLTPVARPVFKANHDWVMRNGGTGLADLLDAQLLAID